MPRRLNGIASPPIKATPTRRQVSGNCTTLQGVPQNDAEAAKWLRLAADQGLASAQCNLGVIYAKGQGVPEDYVLAYVWFNLSAAQGIKEAAKNRDTAARFMTPEQIAEAQKLAREWKPTTQPTK